MEVDSGFTFVTSSDNLWEGPTLDPKVDAENMLQEAKRQEKPADDDDDDEVGVDPAFRMEGAG